MELVRFYVFVIQIAVALAMLLLAISFWPFPNFWLLKLRASKEADAM